MGRFKSGSLSPINPRFVKIEELTGHVPSMVKRALLVRHNYCTSKPWCTEDTQCMCKEFRDQPSGVCSCGLYSKQEYELILYTMENSPACDEIRKLLDRANVRYIESQEYPYQMTNLPMAENRAGTFFTAKELKLQYHIGVRS